MAEWFKRSPGHRPYDWWFTASEPRKRLGGIGTPVHEKLAFQPGYKFGIPDQRVIPVLVKWYPDKSLQVIDPDAPPLFESEASYLERFNLLADAERESLPADTFEPDRSTKNRRPTNNRWRPLGNSKATDATS